MTLRRSVPTLALAAGLLATAVACSGTTGGTATEAPAATSSTTATTAAPATTARRATTSTSRRTGGDDEAGADPSPVTSADLGGIDPAGLGDLPSRAPYQRYVTVRDDTGQVRVEVPLTWEHDGSIRTIKGVDVPNVVASSLLSDYYDDRTAPGMRLAAYQGDLADGGIEAALRHEAEVDHLDECTGTTDTTPFSLGGREGTARVTTGCGRNGDVTVVLVAAAAPDGTGDLAVLQVALVSTADVPALATILRSASVP